MQSLTSLLELLHCEGRRLKGVAKGIPGRPNNEVQAVVGFDGRVLPDLV